MTPHVCRRKKEVATCLFKHTRLHWALRAKHLLRACAGTAHLRTHAPRSACRLRFYAWFYPLTSNCWACRIAFSAALRLSPLATRRRRLPAHLRSALIPTCAPLPAQHDEGMNQRMEGKMEIIEKNMQPCHCRLPAMLRCIRRARAAHAIPS